MKYNVCVNELNLNEYNICTPPGKKVHIQILCTSQLYATIPPICIPLNLISLELQYYKIITNYIQIVQNELVISFQWFTSIQQCMWLCMYYLHNKINPLHAVKVSDYKIWVKFQCTSFDIAKMEFLGLNSKNICNSKDYNILNYGIWN